MVRTRSIIRLLLLVAVALLSATTMVRAEEEAAVDMDDSATEAASDAAAEPEVVPDEAEEEEVEEVEEVAEEAEPEAEPEPEAAVAETSDGESVVSKSVAFVKHKLTKANGKKIGAAVVGVWGIATLGGVTMEQIMKGKDEK